jgi:serine/threonine protein kinase
MMAFLASQGLPEGTMIDGWKVLKKLGSGGFGAVHQVEKNCRLYALKLALLPQGAGDDKKTYERTVRELLCLLLLNHPNIVRVHGHGHYPDERGGHLYLALEYVEGWTVAQWVERTHPTALELIRVFMKIAEAVAYMHARGVFHRDLKLLNVLIRKSDGEPIIIDFGAASFTQAPELTDGGLPPATERARAPEANRWWWLNRKKPRARYDFRVTDELFAFGVMLYDALTDPCPAQQRERTAVNTLLVPPKAPQERNPRIPAALASLVRRLLARDPAQRPESFEAVRRELAELLEHQGPEYRVPVHLPSAQVESLAQAPAAGEKPRSEGALVKSWWGERRARWVGGAVGAAVLTGVAGYMLSRGSDFAPPVQAPDSIVSPPLEKEPDVKTRKSAQPSPLMQQNVPRFASEAERLEWCKALGLGTALAMSAGCPGAQLRPPMPAPCPAEAIKAMEAHGLDDYDMVRFTFGGSDEDPISPPLKHGRVEATVIYQESLSDPANLPNGTRLFGELWTAPNPYDPESGYAYVRFDRVRVPNGPEFPVCIVASDDGDIVVDERPAPGVVRVGFWNNGYVVYEWPRWKG